VAAAGAGEVAKDTQYQVIVSADGGDFIPGHHTPYLFKTP